MMLGKKDLELYHKDLRELIAETGDPYAFILFDDSSYEEVRERIRKEREKKETS